MKKQNTLWARAARKLTLRRRRRTYGLRAALTLEPLDARLLMTGDLDPDVDASPDENYSTVYDINGDESVSPVDALIVTNYVNEMGDTETTSDYAGYDVNEDGMISMSDMEEIVEYMEAESADGSSDDEEIVEEPSAEYEEPPTTYDADDGSGNSESEEDEPADPDPTETDSDEGAVGDPGGNAEDSAGGTGANPSCTSFGDRNPSDRWISGSLGTSGSTIYYVMEYDHDGDGNPDGEAVANADGSHRYVPAGLPEGTISLATRSRGWNYTTQSLVYTDWQSTAFRNLPWKNGTPVITAFQLQTTTGSQNGLTASAYNLLVGQVDDDCNAGGVTVELDHDQDGVSDGVVITANDGTFRYRPADLPAGPVTVQARPLQWDFSSNAYLVGDWHAVTFFNEMQPNEPPILFALNAAGGKQPIVSGRVNNEYSLANIRIEIDDDNDQVADLVTATSTWGEFTIAMDGLPIGTTTIHVRACELDGQELEELCSAWDSLSIDHTQPAAPQVPNPPVSPTPPDVVTVAPAIDTVDADPALLALADSITPNWQNVPHSVAGITSRANSVYDETKTFLDEQHTASVVAADAERVDALNAADTAYGAAVRTADAAFAANSAAARQHLLEELGPFDGDTASLDFEDFVFPEAPHADRLTIPFDSEQRAAPIPPRYDGPEYAFATDQVYQSRLTDAKAARNSAAGAAHHAFVDAESDANTTLAGATQTLATALSNARAAADAALQAAIDAPHPSMDMDHERQLHANDVTSIHQNHTDAANVIHDAYHAALQVETARHAAVLSQLQADLSTRNAAAHDLSPHSAVVAALAASHRIYAHAIAEENRLFARTLASMHRARAEQLADVGRTRDDALAPAERNLAGRQVDHDHGLQAARILATFDRDEAYTDALRTHDRDLATAVELRDRAVIAAREAETIAVAVADATLWRDEAHAKQDAVAAWQAVGTPWIDHQARLAAEEAVYVNARADAYLAHGIASAGATRTKAYAGAGADKQHRHDTADAEHRRSVDHAGAQRDLDVGANDLARDRAMSILDLERDRKLNAAHQAHVRTMTLSEAAEIRDLALADTQQDFAIATGDAYADFIASGYQAVYALAVANANSGHTFTSMRAGIEFTFEEVRLEAERQQSSYEQNMRYSVWYNDARSEQVELTQLASFQEAFDVAVGDANGAYTAAIVSAHTTRDGSLGTADAAWWYVVADADKSYDDAISAAAIAWNNGDAASLAALERQVATDFVARVAHWASDSSSCSAETVADASSSEFLPPDGPTDEPEPEPPIGIPGCLGAWEAYQLRLAVAEKQRVTAAGDARVTYIADVGTAEQVRFEAGSTSDKQAVTAQASAAAARVLAGNEALLAFGQANADATSQHATRVAAAVTQHDMGVAQANLDLHANAAMQITGLQYTVDIAEYDEEEAVAAAYRDYQIAESEAHWIYRIAVAAAEDARNNGSISYEQYEQDIASASNDLNAGLSAASEANSAAFNGARLTEFGTRLIAESDGARAIAEAQKTASDTRGTLAVGFATDTAHADNILAGAVQMATSKLADDRYDAAVDYGETVADAAYDQTMAHAASAKTYIDTVAGHVATYDEALDGVSSADRTAAAFALGTYHFDLFSEHADGMSAAASGSLAVGRTYDLLRYRAATAESDTTHSDDLRTAGSGYHSELTTAYSQLVGTTNPLEIAAAASTSAADLAYTLAAAEATRSWSIDFDTALADRERDGARADAVRTLRHVHVASEYKIQHASAQSEFDAAVSAAYVTFIDSKVAAENYRDNFLEAYPDQWGAWHRARVDVMLAQAENDFDDAKAAARTAYVDTIGIAQAAHSSGWGDPETQHAQQMDSIATAYSAAINAAEMSYSEAVTAAANTHVHDTVAADRTYDIGMAGADRGFVDLLGNADVAYQRLVGDADVLLERDLAAAWGDNVYLTPTNLSARRESPYDELQVSLRTAHTSWSHSVGGTYASYRAAVAQSASDRDVAVAEAYRDRNNRQADADFEFLAGTSDGAGTLSGGLSELTGTLRIDDVGAQQRYHGGLTERENDRRERVADAHGSFGQQSAASLVDRVDQLAAAEHVYQLARAIADEALSNASGMAENTYRSAVEAAESNYIADVLATADPASSSEQRQLTLDAAETALNQALEAAYEQHQADSDAAEQVYRSAKADAQLSSETTRTERDYEFVAAGADVNRTFTAREATAVGQLANDLAEQARAYHVGAAGLQQTLDNAYDEAQVALWQAEQLAEKDHARAVAAARAGYWASEYGFQEYYLHDQSVQMPIVGARDWQDYLADLSMAKYEWWGQYHLDYLDWNESIIAADTAYQDAFNHGYATREAAFATADHDQTVAVAAAAEMHNKRLALSQFNYVASMLEPSYRDVTDRATAEREYRVAMAAVARDSEAGVDGAGNPISDAALSAAASAAGIEYSTALNAARDEYFRAEVVASGIRHIAIAAAKSVYVDQWAAATLDGAAATSAFDWSPPADYSIWNFSTDEPGFVAWPEDCVWTCPPTTAGAAWVLTTEAAQLDYATLLAGAGQAQAVALSLADRDYWSDEALSFNNAWALQILDMPPDERLPWHFTDTYPNWAGSVSTGVQAHTQSTADANLAHHTAVADARHAYFTGLAAAQGQRDRELAGAQVTQAQIDALAAAKSLVAGTYDPARPVYPVTPEPYPYALDIIFAEDYAPRRWRAPGGYDPIAEMNATSLPSQRGDYFDEYWYMSRWHASIRDGLIRDSESWAGNHGENFYYESQDNNGLSGDGSSPPPSTPRVALSTTELLSDFHAYIERFVTHTARITSAGIAGGGGGGDDGVLVNFQGVGLADDYAFKAYQSTSEDAVDHLSENSAPAFAVKYGQSTNGSSANGSGTGSTSTGLETDTGDPPGDDSAAGDSGENQSPNPGQTNPEGASTSNVPDSSNKLSKFDHHRPNTSQSRGAPRDAITYRPIFSPDWRGTVGPILDNVVQWYFQQVQANNSRHLRELERLGSVVAKYDENGRLRFGFIIETLQKVPSDDAPFWHVTATAGPYFVEKFFPTGVYWLPVGTTIPDVESKRMFVEQELKLQADNQAIEIAEGSVEALYDMIIPAGGRFSRELFLDGKITFEGVIEALVDGFSLFALARITSPTKISQIRHIEQKIIAREATQAEWKWYSSELRHALRETTARQVAPVSTTIVPKGATRPFSSFDDFIKGRDFFDDLGRFDAAQARKAWEVYQRASTSKGLLIGGKKDVANALADGWDKLGTLNWSQEINRSWVDGAVDARLPVRLVSPPSVLKKLDWTRWEIGYLLSRGYELRGGVFVPK